MKSFVQYTPTRIYFGEGAENQTAEAVRDAGGTNVLIVYGGRSAEASGLLDRIRKQLNDAGIRYESFGGAKPNPVLKHAEEGAAKAAAMKADFILAVGGGSAIDTAKAIAHGAANPGVKLWDIWQNKYKLEKSLPVGTVLTISAAGSEMSNSAVLTNEELGIKSGLSTDINRPVFAIMDPVLTYTIPKYQLTCGIVDIMMHTMERYFSTEKGLNEMTDGIAEALLRNVIANGRIAVADQHNYDAMSELMWCGSLSHNGITGLGRPMDFSAHKLGMPISAVYDMAHGATLSLVWCHWANYVKHIDIARFARFAREVWNIEEKDDSKAADAGIVAASSYFRELGMPTSFGESETGIISEKEIEKLADLVTADGTRKAGVFLPLGREECLAIYRMANK